MNEFEKWPRQSFRMTNDLLAYGRFCRHYGMQKNLAREDVISLSGDPCENLPHAVAVLAKQPQKYARRSFMNIIRSPDGAVYLELNDMGNGPKK